MEMKIDKYINQIIEGNCVDIMKKFDDDVIENALEIFKKIIEPYIFLVDVLTFFELFDLYF